MLDALSRTLFLTLSRSSVLKKAASRYGMRGPRGFARRFIGGETIDESIGVVHELGQHGFTHTLNHLGKHVASPAVAGAPRMRTSRLSSAWRPPVSPARSRLSSRRSDSSSTDQSTHRTFDGSL